MSNIKKIGTKQWATVILSLALATSSLFIPLEERGQESGSFSVTANSMHSEHTPEGATDRS